MHRLLIIADDLTGAADCAAAFASCGLNSVVVLGKTEEQIDSDVLAIDANTRCLSAEAAAAETTRMVRTYMRNRDCLLFKKLDSTLRGNVAAELAAALAAIRELATDNERVVVLLAPAFPAAGRTTANGRQLIHGRTLVETESPRGERRSRRSNINEILRDDGMTSALIDLASVRAGTHSLRSVMSRLAEQADVLVCDAETDSDLQEIAIASMFLGRGTIWAGSAGLAYHLPRAAGMAQSAASLPNEPLAAGPTLFVVGSRSHIAREQVAVLATSPSILTINVSTHMLIEGPRSELWHKHEGELSEALASGNDVAVLLISQPSVEREDLPLLSTALAQLVVACADRVGALVATGGDTARAVLEAWGILQLQLVGELEFGLPISLAGNWSRRLPVLTKSGSFGTAQTLVHCRQFLHELDRSSAANLYRRQGA